MGKRDDSYGQFLLDMLFVSIVAQDHEDAMNDILDIIVDEDLDEATVDQILFAADFAGAYHLPTSMEKELLDNYRTLAALDRLNE
jgi:hypothetical protein